MKRFILALCCLCALTASAASSDWYLYFWSDTYSLDSDVARFQTTDDADIFLVKSVNVPASGFNFGVHNADWSTTYGWKDAAVMATDVEVGLAASDQANGWLALPAGDYSVTFDAVNLTVRFADPVEDETPEEQPAKFLLGGDLSMATYVEDWGAKFYYQDGTQGDLFDILQAYGVNLARLRVYNEPGTAVNDGGTIYRTPIMSSKYPNGYPYAGQDDILHLAKRAKDHKMAICLSIYLSDYWSGATCQMIPEAWNTATTLEGLGDSVYNYVHRYMTRMKDQETLPEFVSVGNETNYGILYQNTQGQSVSFGGHIANNSIANAVYLFNKAYDAIKDVSPSSQVIIHNSYGHQGKIGQCRSFFKNLVDNGCKFDVVGGSYYPYWASEQGATDQTPNGMLTWAKDMENNIHKPVMIMEVGYSWNPYRSSGRNGGNYKGQLELNGDYYNEASEDGQAAFMKELHDAIATDDNILGYMYWDPIFVDQKVNGWWIKTCWAEQYSGSGDTWWEAGNIISNTTLFDFTGKPLKALYEEIYSRKPEDKPTSVEDPLTTNPSTVTDKIIKDGQFIIRYNNTLYTILGQAL